MDAFVFGTLCEEGQEHEAAWRLLACALAEIFTLGELPAVAEGARGKPYFPQYPAICFNLSHSYGAAVCVVHEKEIGIDIEKLRSAPKRVANGMEDAEFFRLWTAKEATLKRSGGGLGALLHKYEPDALCVTRDDFLAGWVVTVCPSEPVKIHFKVIESKG